MAFVSRLFVSHFPSFRATGRQYLVLLAFSLCLDLCCSCLLSCIKVPLLKFVYSKRKAFAPVIQKGGKNSLIGLPTREHVSISLNFALLLCTKLGSIPFQSAA